MDEIKEEKHSVQFNPELLDEAIEYIRKIGNKPRTGAETRKQSIKFNPEKVPERLRETVNVLLIELHARKILADAITVANANNTRTLEPDFSKCGLPVIERVQGIIMELGGKVR